MRHVDVEYLIATTYRTVRENRVLWFLGFLGVLPGLISVGANLAATLSRLAPYLQIISRPGLTAAITPPAGSLTDNVFTGLTVPVIVVLLTVFAESCLITAVGILAGGDPVTLWKALSLGMRSLPRMLGLWLITGVIAVLMLLVLSIPIGLAVLGGITAGASNVPLVAAFAVLGFGIGVVGLFAVAVVGIVYLLAGRYLIIGQLTVGNSLSSAWRLLRARTTAVAITWWLAAGMGILFAAAALGIMAVLSVPASLLVAVGLSSPVGLSRIGTIITAVAFLSLSWLAIQALVQAFFSTYWTHTYLELDGSKGGLAARYRQAPEQAA